MNKRLIKLLLLMIILVINTIIISACSKQNNDNVKIEESSENTNKVTVNKDNANALNILGSKNIIIENENDNVLKVDTHAKVENSSTFDISNIWLKYEELDKSKNIISESETFIDITLNPGEIAYVGIDHKEYTKSINIVGYKYNTTDKEVILDLKNNNVKIINSDSILENSKKYEILAISNLNKISESEKGNKYKVKIKNSSNNNLGNITLRVAQLNDKGEYIMVEHISSYSVLNPNEETDIDIVTSNEAKEAKIIGYIYDDVKEKANVDIDLKSHRAKINK